MYKTKMYLWELNQLSYHGVCAFPTDYYEFYKNDGSPFFKFLSDEWLKVRPWRKRDGWINCATLHAQELLYKYMISELRNCLELLERKETNVTVLHNRMVKSEGISESDFNDFIGIQQALNQLHKNLLGVYCIGNYGKSKSLSS
jgi:hypothetical protein